MSELQRRLVHASGSLVPLGYLAGVAPWSAVKGLLVVSALVATVLEVLRLGVGLDWAIYDRLTREYEQDNPAGYALYIVGMAVVAGAVSFGLPIPVAIAAMLMLAIGDPISGLLGSTEASNVKQLWVLLVMFGVCTLLAAPFVPTAAAVLGGVAATFADGVKPTIAGYVVDDNLSIPVLGAVAMWVGLVALSTL